MTLKLKAIEKKLEPWGRIDEVRGAKILIFLDKRTKET